MTVFCDGKEAEPEQGTVHRERDLGAPHPDIVPGHAPGSCSRHAQRSWRKADAASGREGVSVSLPGSATGHRMM